MTFEERLEAIAMNLELFMRESADNEAKSQARHARNERSLRRWAALGVKEARKHRERQREFDVGMTRLAAAQLVTEEKLAELSVAQKVTEEKLAAYLSSLGTGRNGGSKD